MGRAAGQGPTRSRDGGMRMENDGVPGARAPGAREQGGEGRKAERGDRGGRSRGDGSNPDRGHRRLEKRGRERQGHARRGLGRQDHARQGRGRLVPAGRIPNGAVPGRRVTGRADDRDRSRAMPDRQGRQEKKRPGMSSAVMIRAGMIRAGVIRGEMDRASTNHEAVDRGGTKAVGRDRVAKEGPPAGREEAGKGRMAGPGTGRMARAGSRMAGRGRRMGRVIVPVRASGPMGAGGHRALRYGTGKARRNGRSAALRSPKVGQAGDRESLRASRGLKVGRAKGQGRVAGARVRQGEDRAPKTKAAARRRWTGCCRGRVWVRARWRRNGSAMAG
jgi:hypothetical protein